MKTVKVQLSGGSADLKDPVLQDSILQQVRWLLCVFEGCRAMDGHVSSLWSVWAGRPKRVRYLNATQSRAAFTEQVDSCTRFLLLPAPHCCHSNLTLARQGLCRIPVGRTGNL